MAQDEFTDWRALDGTRSLDPELISAYEGLVELQLGLGEALQRRGADEAAIAGLLQARDAELERLALDRGQVDFDELAAAWLDDR